MAAGSSIEWALGAAADVPTPPAGKIRIGADTTSGFFIKDSAGVVTFIGFNAMVFKGAIDASTSPNYPAASAGDLYRVSVAGKIGGASGVNVEIGDLFFATADNAGGTQAAVGSSWSVEQGNIDGAVIGPASVTDDVPAVFDGTTGKLIKQKTYAAFKTLLALVKGDVGLGNVDNTSDANKPVSTAQQTALDLKAPLTPTVGAALGTTGTVNLDLSALNGTLQTIALTGDITFTTSNLAAGRSVSLFISAAALRAFTFPAWLFVGVAAPASVAAGKAGVLTLTSTGTTDAAVYAAWAATP